MCRYACYRPYKNHYACFACRKMFRRRLAGDRDLPVKRNQDELRPALCPQCRAPMADMGLDFKAPRQSDRKQWEKVRRLFAAGVSRHTCGCSGGGVTAKTLRDVEPFLAARAEAWRAAEREERTYRRQEAWREKARARALLRTHLRTQRVIAREAES